MDAVAVDQLNRQPRPLSSTAGRSAAKRQQGLLVSAIKTVGTGLVAATGLLFAAISTAQEARMVRVSLEHGTGSTVLTDRIRGHEYVLYRLHARTGQFLKVSLRPDSPSAEFNLYLPGRVPGDEALYSSAAGGSREYYGQLYVDGDHTVSVFLNCNAGRLGQVANYDIAFELSPLHSPQAACQPGAAPALQAAWRSPRSEQIPSS